MSLRRLKSSETALLIIDLITDFKFEDGKKIAAASLPAAHRIARLRRRASEAGMPCIFVNDNQQQWKLEFSDIVKRCRHPGCLGAPFVKLLEPTASDYFVLKPTHAGFYGTMLERLLKELKVRTLILGVTGPKEENIRYRNPVYSVGYSVKLQQFHDFSVSYN